jgi:hypothetical protein
MLKLGFLPLACAHIHTCLIICVYDAHCFVPPRACQFLHKMHIPKSVFEPVTEELVYGPAALFIQFACSS